MNEPNDKDYQVGADRLNEFKHRILLEVKAAVLRKALLGLDVSADDIPEGTTQGDIHVSGIAMRTLVRTELLEFVRYEKSRRPSSHGRPVMLCRIPPGAHAKTRTWFERNGIPIAPPAEEQGEIAFG